MALPMLFLLPGMPCLPSLSPNSADVVSFSPELSETPNMSPARTCLALNPGRICGSLPWSLSLFTFTHWRRKWQPTPVFLPGESQGTWWASVYGVAQSRTQLKQLSSSSSSSNTYCSPLSAGSLLYAYFSSHIICVCLCASLCISLLIFIPTFMPLCFRYSLFLTYGLFPSSLTHQSRSS